MVKGGERWFIVSGFGRRVQRPHKTSFRESSVRVNSDPINGDGANDRASAKACEKAGLFLQTKGLTPSADFTVLHTMVEAVARGA